MNQPRVIQRFSSLMLATLLLFTAVWGHGSTAQLRRISALLGVSPLGGGGFSPATAKSAL